MPTTVKLVIAAPLPPPVHGLSVVANSLAAALAERCLVKVANLSPGDLVPGWRYRRQRLRRAIMALLSLVRLAHGPHHLYLAVSGGLGNVYLLAIATVGRLLGYRMFLDHHSFNYFDRRSRLVALLCLIAGVDATHAVLCPRMRRLLQAKYPVARNVLIVSNAARSPVFLTEPEPHSGPLVIGHLSNLSHEKGLGIILDTCRRALAEGLDVRFELAGPATPGATADIRAAIDASCGRLVWHGPLYGDNKVAFFRALDVFCFPTEYRNEAQPLVLLEALACGAPVLTYGRGCISDDVTPEMGHVVPVGDSFTDAALPLLRRWAADRPAVEAMRCGALEAFLGARAGARANYDLWLRLLAGEENL